MIYVLLITDVKLLKPWYFIKLVKQRQNVMLGLSEKDFAVHTFYHLLKSLC